jgi:hypothetical protein
MCNRGQQVMTIVLSVGGNLFTYVILSEHKTAFLGQHRHLDDA